MEEEETELKIDAGEKGGGHFLVLFVVFWLTAGK